MFRNFLLALLLGIAVSGLAQSGKPGQNKPLPATQTSPKKYPSLLWEITGNGLKKPSYLFGTMHVSDKLAFHLGDSFYNALKSVEVVALETNPEFWQDDYSRSFLFGNGLDDLSAGFFAHHLYPIDRMSITSFAIDEYAEAIKASLAVEPSMINGFLYRSYGSGLDDFEEDTYLDMYIFQAGKKLGKKLTGVENFRESEKLVMEAYRDMMRDRNKKRRSYDFESWITNPKKLEDAYRRGDLDVLDSLQSLSTISEAFEEKFLYKRNEIQAYSIDTILKKHSLFVAVGAAHLPGKRGIIEMLRQMGYTLRPIKMDDRNSVQKETIDRIRYPLSFTTQTSGDSLYSVNIPGKKFYRFTEWNGMDVVQYADMVNGAYYMVTRIKTNSLSWGHNMNMVHRKIDSFMYENVPGKILRKTPITRNGYKGWEIHNRTRRGDHQRYHVYVTPFEIVIFKMSGNGDYITKGTEAQQFFGSIKLKAYQPGDWMEYTPPAAGFSVRLPHRPSVIRNEHFGANRFEYAAFDQSGNSYIVMQSNLHNYAYAEEDSFELNLMEDSYAFSAFIEKRISRRFLTQNGYPALEAKYLHKNGSYSTARYIIRGPVYYVVIANYKNENEAVRQFFNSFTISPFVYPGVRPHRDTALHFTVQSPVFTDSTKLDPEMNEFLTLMRFYMEEGDERESLYKTRMIGNDTTGEKVFITYHAPSKYAYYKDSTGVWERVFGEGFNKDSGFIRRLDKQYELAEGLKCRELHLTDTGSSRLILSKWFYRDGHVHGIFALTDTLSPPSTFLHSFFSTFRPADTLKGPSLFTRKTAQFFHDFFSTDSATAKKARRLMYEMKFDSLDQPLLKDAITRLNWDHKNYLNSKQYFIRQLAKLKDASTIVFFKELYAKAKDTSELQQAILDALLGMKTRASFAAFKDLVLQEPPLSDASSYDYDYPASFSFEVMEAPLSMAVHDEEETRFYGRTWWPLYDTMALTKTIFPDLLQLMHVDDYRERIMDLLTLMVDSGYAKPKDYEAHFSKLYIDAKQLLKKQNAEENRQTIEKIERKESDSFFYGYEEDDEELDRGNSRLEQYATLLMPFYESHTGVPDFFAQLLRTRDRRLLYDIFILMLRHNRPVPDSLFEKYAKLDAYRAHLYRDLQKMKKLDRFPVSQKSQEAIARSLFFTDARMYQQPDTVVYIGKLPVTYKEKKGFVYFFKYKPQRDDTFWEMATVGLQPENPDSIDVKNREFTKTDGYRIENDKTLEEQMQKMLKEVLYSQRPSAMGFYDARGYNIYKAYLPDMVKHRRYRD